MVTFETAVQLHGEGISAINAVWPDSPLAKKLKAQGLRTLELSPAHKYIAPLTVYRLRRALQCEQITTVLVQQLRDLWVVEPALIGRPHTRVIGMAHMWIDAHKQDWLHRRLYGRLHRLVALTESHKQNLYEHLPVQQNQFMILPNTVDSERFHPRHRSAKVREELTSPASPHGMLIGVVSRLDPKKGLLDVLAAAEELRQSGADFQIAIIGSETIGEPTFKSILQNEIARRGHTQSVRLAGHRPDIEAVMASLDVLLMPSPAETFGRVLIEAMASGVAVVASSGGGVKDVVDDGRTGLLVAPHDTHAMAAALKRLADDAKLRRELALNGLDKAHRSYDSKLVFRELVSLFI